MNIFTSTAAEKVSKMELNDAYNIFNSFKQSWSCLAHLTVSLSSQKLLFTIHVEINLNIPSSNILGFEEILMFD